MNKQAIEAIHKPVNLMSAALHKHTVLMICSEGYMHFANGEFIGIHKPKQQGQSWKQKMTLAGNAIPKSLYPYGKLRCLRAGHRTTNQVIEDALAAFNKQATLRQPWWPT